MIVYALIPARGGSKSIKLKNLVQVGGFPLIAYSIAAARMCHKIDRVIVSTDHMGIAKCALRYGAEVPFMRPDEFAQDDSTDLQVFQHAVEWFAENEKVPEVWVQLRPTTPLRSPGVIESAISVVEQGSSGHTGARSIHEVSTPPHKLLRFDNRGRVEGFFEFDPRPEYYNLPRQTFERTFWGNGVVDIVLSKTIRAGAMYGPRAAAILTKAVPDVDTQDDLDYIEYLLQKNECVVHKYLKERHACRV